MKVLLVEDDELLGSAVKTGLQQCGYVVDWVRNSGLAEASITFEQPDLLVLDLGLPDRDGLDLLKDLRGRGVNIPVLILTARDTVEDRINGLDCGADDYVVKPFNLGELTARLRAIARRNNGRAVPTIKHGDLEFDPASRSVSIAGKCISLSAKELAILEALLDHPLIPMSRERLEQILYGSDETVGSNAVEVHIHQLRKKLGKDRIRTIRGLGYMIPKQ